MEGIRELAPIVGVTAACRAVGLPRSSYYLPSGHPRQFGCIRPATAIRAR